MCPARPSPDSSYFRTPNISTHRHSWVRETANIMPHRIGSAERLNARMYKVSMESTPTCGVQMCDSGMAESDEEHIKLVREWASFVWGKWSAHHQQIRSFVAEHS